MMENWLSNNGILGCRFLGTRSFFKRLRRYSLVSIIVLTVYTPAGAGDVFKDVPGNIDPNAKYLFYMHGFAVEQGGPRAKAYDYSGILKELAKRGFVVIGEERSRVRNDVYAEKVAGQVKKLLAAGVANQEHNGGRPFQGWDDCHAGHGNACRTRHCLC